MPQELTDKIIRLIPYENKKDYTIIDPFCGTGTFGASSIKYGYNFIGIDIDETYCKIARNRLKTLEMMIK